MKTNLTRPMTFFLIGMPRGGTTIITRLLNSLEDGFCLGEPAWYWQSQQPTTMLEVQKHCFGKVDGIVDESLRPTQLISWIKKRVQQGDYQLGGYKETLFIGNPVIRPMIEQHKKEVDFFLVVFRDPIKTHSSQWALGWEEAQDVAGFIGSYRELDILAKEQKAIPLVLEQFSASPLAYLNARLPFQIEGSLQLLPTGHSFGDPYANHCEIIEPRKRETCLPQEVQDKHTATRAIWEYWSRS